MKLEKIKKSFNDYKLELSWGQVEAIAAALSQNHSDPLADELYAEWQWYTERVPGPGEDEEEIEAQQQAAEGGIPGEGEGDGDLPIPMPPGSSAGTPPEGGEEPTFPPEEGAEGGEGQPTEAAMKLGAKPPGGDDIGLPEPGMEGGEEAPPLAPPSGETDRRLPKPPRE